MDTTYLSEGNTKTGDAASFDLPAIKTCPGSTETCRAKCYAARLMKMYSNVDAKYERNFLFAESLEFVEDMVHMLPRKGTIRIHVSGDFYSQEYIQKWIQIASRKKNLHFYCYTRSWTVDYLLADILRLSELPNVTVNLSLDKDTGLPNFVGAEEFRWCYMTDDDTVIDGLRRTDIVFRTKHSGHKTRRKNAAKKGVELPPLLHRLGGATVCPLERGTDLPLTCSECRLCIV